uniref:Uncharacterized protein n=1 Tax=Oryza brachyantha TaxID=4533 RepID=J3N7S7_ORYBR
MEDSVAGKRPQRGRCNCFHGSNYEEGQAGGALENLKGFVQNASVVERNLLAGTSRIAERCGKKCKARADYRRMVADGLRPLGYHGGVCR